MVRANRWARIGIRAALWLIFVVLPLAALLQPSRASRLRSYLSMNSAILSSRDSARVDQWVQRTLVRSGSVQSLKVNCAPGKGPTLILTTDGIPGVIPRLQYNAAYDPSLDAIFLDARFMKKVLALGLPDNSKAVIPPYDPDLGSTSRDLLLFVLLHELGHRSLRHRSMHAAFDAWPSPPRDSGAQRLELAADEYALEMFRRGGATDRPLTWDEVYERLIQLIGLEVLSTLPAEGGSSISVPTRTHPALLKRCQRLLEVISRERPVAPGVKASAVLYAKLLGNYWGPLIAELAPQSAGSFRHACLAHGRLYLVRDDGAISSVALDSLVSALRKVNPNDPAFRVLPASSSAAPDSLGMYISQALTWSTGDTLFFATEMAGGILSARRDRGWRWSWAHIDSLLEYHRPEWLLQGSHGWVYLFEQAREWRWVFAYNAVADRLLATKYAAGPLPQIGAAGPYLMRQSDWTGVRNGEVFEYALISDSSRPVAGTLSAWNPGRLSARRQVLEFHSDSVEVPERIVPCSRDDGFVGIWLRANGDSIGVAHYDKAGRVQRRGVIASLRGALRAEGDTLDLTTFNPGPAEACFTLQGSHRIVFQLAASGLCVFNLDDFSLTHWIWMADASTIGLELGSSGLILTQLGGSSRLAIWRAD